MHDPFAPYGVGHRPTIFRQIGICRLLQLLGLFVMDRANLHLEPPPAWASPQLLVLGWVTCDLGAVIWGRPAPC